MESVIETNGEPVTIKITIEIIPGKKKGDNVDIKEQFLTSHKEPVLTPEGWKVVEPTPVIELTPLVEPEPIATPEKKKRAYTKKAKTTEEPPVEEEKKPESISDEKPSEAVPTKVEVKPAPTSNKVVARIAQMIRFYCKASGIEPSTITIAQLKEKAFDIVENVTDDVITEAIKEASGK